MARRRSRPADVSYYFDADVLGLAHIVSALRSDVTYPGDPGGVVKRRERPACPITTTDTPDDVWIPQVSAEGWAIITRDKGIERRPREREVVLARGAKLFAITSDEKLDVWRQLEILLSRWREVERLSATSGPFMYGLTRTGYRKLL